MNLIIKKILAVFLLSSLSLAHAEPPVISEARIIQPPPGSKVAAAYFTIHNDSKESLVITGASSDAIPHISIHLSAVVDDVAKMIPQDSVTIESESSLEFKHGSFHLMLMGLKSPLTAGSMLAIEIDSSIGVIPIMIPIITPDEASSMQSHSMKHDSKTMESESMKHGDSMQHDKMDASESMDKN